MSAGRNLAASAGAILHVIPGYQAWTGPQRDKALSLREAGELERVVWARMLADGAAKVWDRKSAFILYRDGEHDRVSNPRPEVEP